MNNTPTYNKALSTDLVKCAEDEHAARGALSKRIRAALLAKEWGTIAHAYGILEEMYGKRHSLNQKVNGKPTYSPSTPADAMRTAIHNVSVSLASKDWRFSPLKPVIVQDAQGNDVWGLVEKKANDNQKRASVAKSLAKSLTQAAMLCDTIEQKQDALEAFKVALGL